VTQNRFEEALKYQLRFSELKDSLFNDEKNKVIQELQVKYETAQKEKQLQENLLIIETRTLQRNWLFVVAILAALLAGSVYLGLKSRLRFNQQMNTQAKEIQLQRIRDLEQQQKIIALDAMMKGQEEERQRIANDLHDGLGGLLSSIKHHFRAMSEKNRDPDSMPVFQKTNAMLDEAHEEVRRIAHNMMPDALSKLGLEASITDLAENYNIENNFQVSFQNLGWSKQPDVSQAIMLYRIVQELLQNVAKHAQATRVFIQFSQFENNLIITVEDNRTGFDLDKINPIEGMGIKSIKSRITYLNGTFETETSPGNGTISIVRVPLPK
jgi:signal transduction histidine kinase